MHSQSLRNSYTESGVVVYSPNDMKVAHDLGQAGAGRHNPTTTQIPKHRSGGKLKVAFLFLALVAVAAAGGYGFKKMKAVQAEADESEQELKVALAQVETAKADLKVAQAKVVLVEEKATESEASLAKLTRAAAKKDKESDKLQKKLEDLLEEGQGQVTIGKDGRLTLQLVDKVLFRSGEAELTTRGARVMSRVGKALAEMKDKQVWVQGHTDNVPVRDDNENFSSNWELSAARALTVVHYLQDESGVNPRRLAAAAFGSHRPVSRKKKAKNRRIEIVLFPLEVKLRR